MSTGFWTPGRLTAALSERLLEGGAGQRPGADFPIERVWTDSRTVQPHDCFVALIGENFDAHDFANTAIAAGASALVLSRVPESLTPGIPVYLVDDTLLALGDLARFRRTAWGGRVVGVGGSNGKTSTKELLTAALGSRYSVHATRGNLNNRVGVPLTLLALPDTADVAVVEMGTSIPGEIATLRDIVRPDITVLTSIAEEHLEGLGDLAGVLAEESALFGPDSVAVIPSSHPELLGPAACSRRVVTAGLDSGDVRAQSWSIESDGSGTAVVDGVSVHSPLRGVHNLRNLMLALATGLELGVPIDGAAADIARLTPPPMRASWERVGRALVINDAYNSNPGSAVAALELLDAAPGAQRVAILGTMRELGANAERCHDDVARAAVGSSADVIAGIGDFAGALGRVAGHDPRVVVADDVEQLWAQLTSRLSRDPVILLKASRGVRLERILPLITDWATQPC